MHRGGIRYLRHVFSGYQQRTGNMHVRSLRIDVEQYLFFFPLFKQLIRFLSWGIEIVQYTINHSPFSALASAYVQPASPYYLIHARPPQYGLLEKEDESVNTMQAKQIQHHAYMHARNKSFPICVQTSLLMNPLRTTYLSSPLHSSNIQIRPHNLINRLLPHRLPISHRPLSLIISKPRPSLLTCCALRDTSSRRRVGH